MSFKLVYLVSLTLALLWFPDLEERAFYSVNARWPRDHAPVFLTHFATWDAAHYLLLAETGYQDELPSCAFYPLWPLVLRWTSQALGANPVLTGMVLANIFSAAAFVLFFDFAKRRFGIAAAKLSLLFLVSFPGSLFFQFNYSEALFLLLLMMFVMGLERRAYPIVLVAGFLLPMTRALGAFCVVPLFWHLISEAGANVQKPPGISPVLDGDQAVDPTRNPWISTVCKHLIRNGHLLLAPLLGYALYFALMHHWTGNALEGFEAQKFWQNVHSIKKLFMPWDFITGFFAMTDWHRFRGSRLDRVAFLVFALCLIPLWKCDRYLFIWAIVLGLIPAMTGTFVSFTRFAAIAFPIYLALGKELSKPHNRTYSILTLGAFSILHLILVWRFVNFRWAG